MEAAFCVVVTAALIMQHCMYNVPCLRQWELQASLVWFQVWKYLL